MESHRHCKLRTSARVSTRMQKGKEEEEINVILEFKVDERESWVTRSTDGASTSVVNQRSTSGPWRGFATFISISNPLPLQRLDRFIHSIILQLGIPDEYAYGIRVNVLSDVENDVRATMERRFKNLVVRVKIGLETVHYYIGLGEVLPVAEGVIPSALSRKTFKKEMERWNDTCVICLEQFVENTQVIQPACLHTFHEECIMNWIRENIFCPICRLRLQDKG
ncbi:putative RING finger protein [Cinnamomum micranthum f. kanehirae]|uniref:RING-type E3 ubiquitin transferase n=1 Tax=Cinnamomum micranthum f. kanehirae TaxID=337451 RepID=A0A3S3NQY7_9MAGN|nr:putative RING finger protein [Cinnamomum micranthum f. kanehirae]